MNTYYTDEKNAQIVISLLKQHGIRKVIASPGATNAIFVASIQQDPWFEIYSSIDERSAAYIACGMAAESGEPVVINCTGATSSRNYMPGMTEAFYRKLPVIAISTSRESSQVGHLNDQQTDRSCPPKDTAKYSATIQIVKDEEDLWDCEMKTNIALLECRRDGGGPVHLNLETKYSGNFEVKELPKYRKIDRITHNDKFPELPNGKIAIFVSSFNNMSDRQKAAIDKFCESNNAVAFCDHTSVYKGKYEVQFSLVFGQTNLNKSKFQPDLAIHIGGICGNYINVATFRPKSVWRVSPDGAVQDKFRKLRYVFDMEIEHFFEYYSNGTQGDDSYLNECKNKISEVIAKIPELPFSNIWIASQLAPKMPENCAIHFSRSHTYRSWGFFDLPKSTTSISNVGGCGIDGSISSIVGASLVNKEKLYYLFIGDLAFFYDMNALGNRHIESNIRILLINNGIGTEFRNYGHSVARFGEDANAYMAAGGHYGDKSPELVKGIAQSLGYEYLCALNKDDFAKAYERFVTPKKTDKPMIFEVFTDSKDESDALKIIRSIDSSASMSVENLAKKIIKEVLSRDNVEKIKQKIR